MIKGTNVKISERAVIYNPDNLVIGDNVRIDDFCILSCGAGLRIGSNIHIAAYTLIVASSAEIIIDDWVGISAHCAFYSGSDDYSGGSMLAWNPLVPDKYKNVTKAPIHIGRHALIGHAVTVMPGVTIGEGVSIGVNSFVTKNCVPWAIYAGCPAKLISPRSTKLLELEKQYLAERDNG